MNNALRFSTKMLINQGGIMYQLNNLLKSLRTDIIAPISLMNLSRQKSGTTFNF